MKLRGALLTVVAATVCALSSLVSPRDAVASIDFVNKWTATPTIVNTGTTGTVTGKLTPGMGTNRLMLVVIATRYASGTPGFTVTYGGQAVTNITAATNTAQLNKIWVGYVAEAGVAAGAASTKMLQIIDTNAANRSTLYAAAAVFNGVDQTNPISTTANAISGATAAAASIPLTLPLTLNQGIAGNNSLAIYFSNWYNTTQNTVSSGYTELREYTSTNVNLSTNYKVTAGTTSESITTGAAASSVGVAAAVCLNPALRLATISAGACGDCHGNPPVDGSARNVPPGAIQGSHEKHAGDGDVGYSLACTVCHRNNPAITHANGNKNIAGSGVPALAYKNNSSIAMTNTPTPFGTCTNITCHSTGRGTGMGTVQYTAPTWGASTTCLSCHAGRATALGAQANSTAGFKLSTTHSQHLKYPAANVNCNMCHGKTAADAATLKQYTGVTRHVNNTRDVTFNDLNYGSYTSYKSTEAGSIANTKVCTNVACHGGKTRSAWNAATTNNDNTCVHCHGIAGTTPADTNRKKYAPGWVSGATGISTDGNTASTDLRVGAHFVHLSSVFMKQIRCNECHAVPSSPFDGTHMTGKRFNSQTVVFTQASTANKNSVTPVVVPGTAAVAATCTTTYCHGSSLKNGDTAGTARSPQWNQNTLTNNTPSVAVCGVCHGAPPNSVTGSHTGATLSGASACSTCHGTVVADGGVIIDKTLHMNGTVEATGCTSCHGFPPTTNAHTVHINNIIAEKALGTLPGGFVNNAVCGSCHNTSALTKHAGDATSDGTNRNIFLPSVFGIQTSYRFGSTDPSYAKGGTTECSNVNCHFGTSTAWGDPPTISCQACHGYPPVTTGADPDNKHIGTPVNHIGTGPTVNTKATFVAAHNGCQICHGTMHNGTGGHDPFITYTVATQHTTGKLNMNGPTGTGVGYNATTKSCDAACHGNTSPYVMTASGKTLYFDYYGTGGDCVSCHAASQPTSAATLALDATVTNRGNMNFTRTSKHTRSRASSVMTKYDCGVCHMEGDATTGSANGTYHKNGYVELRDPDLGTVIKAVTHSGTTSVAGVYSNSANDAVFVRFKRNLGATLEAETATIPGKAVTNFQVIGGIMVNFCLKCHDAAGATNATAIVAGGSALKPFNATVAANPGGNVLDVASQFASTNRSFHPVLVKQNSGYTNTAGTRMVAPWNGVTKSATTAIYGPLISCWDCHAPNGATGTITTTDAHSGTPSGSDAVVLRGNVYVNSATTTGNLCVNCHVVSGGTSNHGTGSAITSGTDGGMTYFQNRCYFCHASDVSRTRPWGAGDAHGYNTRGGVAAGGTAFPAASNGYAFIRSEGWYGNAYQQVIRSVGATTYTQTCNGRGTAGGGAGACSRGSMGGYTPGGVY